MKRINLPVDSQIGCLSSSEDGRIFISSQNIIITLDHQLEPSIWAGDPEEHGFRLGKIEQALFDSLLGIYASSSALYVYEDSQSILLRVIDGVVEKYAGCGEKGFQDGPATVARFSSISSITMSSNGLLFLSDTYNNLIRIIYPNGIVTSIGSGREEDVDGNFPFECGFATPFGLYTAPDDSIMVSCTNGNSVRVLDWKERYTTTYCESKSSRYLLPTGTAGSSSCNHPLGIACSTSGHLYIAVSSTNSISTIAPNGIPSFLDARVPDVRFLAISYDGKYIIAASSYDVYRYEINGDPPHLVSCSPVTCDLTASLHLPSFGPSSTLQLEDHPFTNFESLLNSGEETNSFSTSPSIESAFLVTNTTSKDSFTLHKEILLLHGEPVLSGTIRFVEETNVSRDCILMTLKYLYGSSSITKPSIEAYLTPYVDIRQLDPKRKLAEALQMLSGQLNVEFTLGSSRRSVPAPIAHPTFLLSVEDNEEPEKAPLLVHDWMLATHFPFAVSPGCQGVLPFGCPPSLLEALVDFFYMGILGEALSDPFNVIYVLANQKLLQFSKEDVPVSMGFQILLNHCHQFVMRPLTDDAAVLILKYRLEMKTEGIEESLHYVARNAVSIFRVPQNQLLFQSLPANIINAVVLETIRWHEEDRSLLNFALDESP